MTWRVLLPEPGPLVGPLEDWYDPGPGPSLRAGLVLSADGATSVEGRSDPLSGPADKDVFRALRTVADGVVVGAGTVRAENYGPVRIRPEGSAWRAARGLAETPPLVVVSARCDLQESARCFGGTTRTVVATCAGAPAEDRERLSRVAEVVVCGEERVDLPALLGVLHGRGLTRLLCEGGPALLTDLVAAGLVDELCLTVSPVLVGGGPALLTRTLGAPVTVTTRHLLAGPGGELLWRLGVTP